MKKTLALILALILVFSLSACSSLSIQTPAGSNDVGQQSTDSGQPSIPETITAPEDDVVTFEELVVVDNDDCLIKITGIEPDNMWGYTLKAYLENKSTDKNYMFSVVSAAVNGVQSKPLFATEVVAGKKSNEDIRFTDSALEDNGITLFTDIEISFRVYDSNDWSADNIAEETIHIYPYGEDKATVFVREAQSSDNIIVDNEYATVIVTGYEEDDICGYTVNLYLLNKSDAEIMFSVDEASVNGFMADPFYATSVSAGKCAFSSMSWSDTTLEDNGITDIEEIEFLFRAYDSNNWTESDFVNETITLIP